MFIAPFGSDLSVAAMLINSGNIKPDFAYAGSCHKRQKPQAPIRNRQTRKVANAKGLNRNTNLT